MEIKYLPFGTKLQLEQEAKEVGAVGEASDTDSCCLAVAVSGGSGGGLRHGQLLPSCGCGRRDWALRLGPGLLCPPPAVLGFPGLHLGACLPAAQAQVPSPAPRALGRLRLCPHGGPTVFPPPPLPICSPLTCLLSIPPPMASL